MGDTNNINFLLVCLALVKMFVMTEGQNTISNCPRNAREWQIRQKLTGCHSGNGFYYHCISSNMNELIEICLIPRSIPSQHGCPIVDVDHGNRFYFQPCTLPTCPGNTSTSYSSNELYSYPGCFHLKENEVPSTLKNDPSGTMVTLERSTRNGTSISETTISSSTLPKYTNDSKDLGYETPYNRVESTVFIGGMTGIAVLFLIAVLAIVTVVLKRRKTKRGLRNSVSIEENNTVENESKGSNSSTYAEIEEPRFSPTTSPSGSYLEPCVARPESGHDNLYENKLFQQLKDDSDVHEENCNNQYTKIVTCRAQAAESEKRNTYDSLNNVGGYLDGSTIEQRRTIAGIIRKSVVDTILLSNLVFIDCL